MEGWESIGGRPGNQSRSYLIKVHHNMISWSNWRIEQIWIILPAVELLFSYPYERDWCMYMFILTKCAKCSVCIGYIHKRTCTCMYTHCCRCGPMTRYWCMRYEAKHSYFKDIAQKTKCFKNIPKSLAERHQRLVCYHFHGSKSLVKEFKTGKGTCMSCYSPPPPTNILLFA